MPRTNSETEMASSTLSPFVILIAVVVLAIGLYLIDPTYFGLLSPKEGFNSTLGSESNSSQTAGGNAQSGNSRQNATTGNTNSAGGDATRTSGSTGSGGSSGGGSGFTNFSGFQDTTDASGSGNPMGFMNFSGFKDASGTDGSGNEGFANMSEVTGPAQFDSAQGPAGCYPRDQLTPSELLPRDQNSTWAQQNPMGTGSLKGKNFLSAGALVGVNTVGQSLRNANYQLRSEPPNPQVPVSVWNVSTIEPDVNRRDLEIN